MKRILGAAAAAGMALALGLGAVPASAVATESDGTQSSTTAGSGVSAAGLSTAGLSTANLSAAGLTEAVARDLGLTPGEFEAAGQLGKRAAEAAASLNSLPGYVGISLAEGRIVVQGSGAALQARVDELNQSGPADFVLRPVATPAEPLTPAAPSASEPSSAAAPDASPAASAEATIAPAPGRSARDIDQLFQEYVRDVGTAGLQAVVFTDGHFVIRTGAHSTPESGVPGIPDAPQPTTPEATVAAPGTASPAEFAARYSNVQLETGASLKTEESYFGGQGYFADNLAICSAGFSAFGPTGLPLVLTAGHCTEDGLAKAADLEPATSSPAGGWKNPLVRPLAPLGKFGFSQFGGVDNSVATSDPATVGTDIAVVEKIRQDLSLEPSALRWDDAENPDPTSVKVIGSTAPVQGQPVCRSGRTTGWKCGTVDSVGIWLMPGRNSLPPLYDNDLRAVRAFDSLSVKSSGGDSGGPWISGNYAVGTHIGSETSSGVQTRALAATFVDSVREIPGGVELELFLNKPAVTSPAPGGTFGAGQTITGQVPAAPASAVAEGSTVRITVEGQAPFEVPVDDAGAWSFAAPAVSGSLRFTAETVNGFSASGASAFVFAPTPAASPSTEATVAGTATAAPAAPAPAPAAVPASHGAVSPAGDAAVVVRPRLENLPETGASGLLLAGGLAALALVAGGALLALSRRRKRAAPHHR
ncbi:S1 family peptidase [Arthrobacter sp. HMWF013]|uniref:S1 family peptidase n=1 Tax=Arthrobacter sp. HMWF013 TaxID=2056849 RepID=UPI002159CAFE|nr:S1 family peptidase [Arthrobacter sp. HMWF013]